MAMSGANIAAYMSNADGALSNGSIWSLIDSVSYNEVAPTTQTGSYNDFINGRTSSTSYQNSGTTFSYTGTAPTIDGIALRITAINSTSGTITVALNTGTNTDVAGTVVTCNVTDLPANGWAFFKFASPVTLATSTTYATKFKTSVNVSVQIKTSNGSAHCQYLRTTTTGTVPQNGSVQRDNIHIGGEITGAGTKSSRVITWDCTSNTNPFNFLDIGNSATLNVENNASTNYYLHVQNDIRISSGGTFNGGTSSTAIQSTSTFTITMHYTTSNASCICVLPGGTLNLYGATKTTVRTFLTANLATSGSSISVNAATDWAIGDVLVVASTTQTQSQVEKFTITSVSGTTIGITPSASFAHSGVSPKQAEVINLTRNVIFQGFSDTVSANLTAFNSSTINIRYVEMNHVNSSYTGFCGIYINSNSTSSFNMQYCSIHDVSNAQVVIVNVASADGTIVFSNNVCYLAGAGWLTTINSQTLLGSVTFDSNVFIRDAITGYTGGIGGPINWGLSSPASFTNNWICNCSGNPNYGVINYTVLGTAGTFSGNVIHGGVNEGIMVNSVMTTALTLTANFSNNTVWNCNYGLVFANNLLASRIVIDGLTCHSNATAHLAMRASMVGDILWNNLQFQAGSSPACPIGIHLTAGANANTAFYQIVMTNSNLGDSTAHSTGDIYLNKTLFALIYMQNCKLGSSTQISGQSNFSPGSFIGSDRHQQTGNGYAAYTNVANTIRDETIYYTSPPSLKVTPLSSTTKFRVGVFAVNCPAGTSPSVAFKIRKSNTSAGDAATYNGNELNLYVSANAQAGISANTLLATTTSASNGAWESIGGSVPTILSDSIVFFFIDLDGTTGWVNIDDFTTSQIQSNAGGMSFSRGGVPNAILGNGSDKYVPLPIIRKKVH